MDLSSVVFREHFLFEGFGMCAALQVVVTLRVMVSDLVRDAFALALPQIMKAVLTPGTFWLILGPEESLHFLATSTVSPGLAVDGLFAHIVADALTASLLMILLLIFLFLVVEVDDKLPVVIIEIMEVFLADGFAGILLGDF